MPGSPQVRVQDRRVSSDAAVFGQVFHAVGDRLLAAVDENVVGIGLEVAIFVVHERCLQVERHAAARVPVFEVFVLYLCIQLIYDDGAGQVTAADHLRQDVDPFRERPCHG